jgi:hypothetical protein
MQEVRRLISRLTICLLFWGTARYIKVEMGANTLAMM